VHRFVVLVLITRTPTNALKAGLVAAKAYDAARAAAAEEGSDL